jgi:hypothetical protein
MVLSNCWLRNQTNTDSDKVDQVVGVVLKAIKFFYTDSDTRLKGKNLAKPSIQSLQSTLFIMQN